MPIQKSHWRLLLTLLILAVFCWGCQPPAEQHLINLSFKNELPIVRQHLPIRITLDQLKTVSSDFTFAAFALAMGDPTDRQNQPERISYQADDLNYDGRKDELLFLLNFQANQAQTAVIQYAPNKEPKNDGDPIAIELIFQIKSQTGIFPKLDVPMALESNLSLFLLQKNGSVTAFAKNASGLHLQQLAKGETVPELVQVNEGQKIDQFGSGGFAIWDRHQKKFLLIHETDDYVRVLVGRGLRAVIERVWPILKVDKKTTISVRHRATVYADNTMLEQQVLITNGGDRFSVIVGLKRGKAVGSNLFKWEAESVGVIVLPTSVEKETVNSTLVLGSTAEWRTHLFYSADEPIQSMNGLKELSKMLVASLNSPPEFTLFLPEKVSNKKQPPSNPKDKTDNSGK